MPDLAVVVLVPEPLRTRMAEARAASGERGAGRVEPHITVVPPVLGAPLDEATVLLQDVCRAHAPFTVQLDGVGTFRPRSPVVFVHVARGQEPLAALERDLRVGPLHRRADWPFNAHATIAMRVPDAELDVAAAALADAHLTWTVDRLALLRRDPDKVWRTECEVPLSGA